MTILTKEQKRLFDFDLNFYRRNFLKRGKLVQETKREEIEEILLLYVEEYKEGFGVFPSLDRQQVDLFRFWMELEERWGRLGGWNRKEKGVG